jgi:hypothetical protein
MTETKKAPKKGTNSPTLGTNTSADAALLAVALLINKGYPLESAIETTKMLMGRVHEFA